MADRAEDVVVAAAVRREVLVGVDVDVIGVDLLGRAAPTPRSSRARRAPIAQPPAIAGSSRTSSRSPTGVSSPSR